MEGQLLRTRPLSGRAFQNTLKTSLCACRLFPTARQFWKALPDSALDLHAVELGNPFKGGVGCLFSGMSDCREQRATALRQRFFAFGETALTTLPALTSAHGRLERFLR